MLSAMSSSFALLIVLLTVSSLVNSQQNQGCFIDVAFVIDESGSIGIDNWDIMIAFIKNVVRQMNIGPTFSRVAAVKFGYTATVAFDLNRYSTLNEVLAAIDSIRYRAGGTNTAGGLRAARQRVFDPSYGDRPEVPNVLILLTDGSPNVETTETLPEADRIKAMGITIVAVGVTTSIDETLLKSIVTPPAEDNYLSVSEFNKLNSSIAKLANSSCRINPPPLPSTTTATTTEASTGCVIDLCLIVDASNNIIRERFPKVIEFLASIIDELEIGPDKTRVGAVKFSQTASVEFQLQSYNNKQDVIAALMRMTFEGGRKNIADALRLAKNRIFDSPDQQNRQKVAILVSDGAANVNKDDVIPSAIALRNSGTFIITIGLGTLVDNVTMKAIASRPTIKSIFRAMSWTNLPDIKDSVIDAICDDVNHCNNDTCCQNGAPCIDDFWTKHCACAQDYTGECCERRCVRNMDVALILDLSGSEEDHYDLVVEFAKMVIMGLPVNSGAARVGIISYSNNARIDVYLDSYTTREKLVEALAFQFDEGKTNTQEAIRLTYQNMFSSSQGDRSGVPNIAVVITDGDSNIQPENTIQEAKNARDRNIEIFAVAMGASIKMDEINGIASQDLPNHVIRSSGSTDVNSLASTLLDRLCQ